MEQPRDRTLRSHHLEVRRTPVSPCPYPGLGLSRRGRGSKHPPEEGRSGADRGGVGSASTSVVVWWERPSSSKHHTPCRPASLRLLPPKGRRRCPSSPIRDKHLRSGRRHKARGPCRALSKLSGLPGGACSSVSRAREGGGGWTPHPGREVLRRSVWQRGRKRPSLPLFHNF